MFNKPLSEIELSDIQDLIDDGVTESRILDFKSQLYKRGNDGSRDFLIDVTALANSLGGNIVIGVREEGLIATEIVPISVDLDKTLQCFEDLLKNNTDRRLSGVRFHHVDAGNGIVLIINVPRSVNRPHAVHYGKYWRFHARNEVGNFQMNVAQLMDVFLSERDEHHAVSNRVQSKMTRHSSFAGGRVELYIAPATNLNLNWEEMKIAIAKTRLPTCTDFPTEINRGPSFTEIAAKSDDENLVLHTRIFRDGILQAVTSEHTQTEQLQSENEADKLRNRLKARRMGRQGVLRDEFVDSFFCAIDSYIEALSYLDAELPLYVYLCLRDLKGHRLSYLAKGTVQTTDIEFDSDTVVIGIVLIKDMQSFDRSQLLILFNDVWSTVGLDENPAFPLG